MALIEPRTLKGFRDYLPEAQIPREWLIETAKKVYRSYGFLPIDTPALEYAEILTGKGGEESDKQMYRFKDHGDRDVALRFDLTVPLARFVAQHAGTLGMPFKRYHVASVWRGENTQRGRYREFMQCDFDTIGTESIASDVETVLVVHDLMRAIGIDQFTIRVNNRKVLIGILEDLGLNMGVGPILRALDKFDKIGVDGVRKELVERVGLLPSQAINVTALFGLESLAGAMQSSEKGCKAAEEKLAALSGIQSSIGQSGLHELTMLMESFKAAGVDNQIELDLSIARGLDYYTGTIVETSLGELPGIGSVCSGGRYNDLANLYTKERLPGIGASLGLDRLLAALEELKKLPTSRATAPIFVPYFDEGRLHDYLRLAAKLRSSGFRVELYPEPKKLKSQLQYADRRGFSCALVIGSDEWTSNTVVVKDLKAGQASPPLELFGADKQLSPTLVAHLRELSIAQKWG